MFVVKIDHLVKKIRIIFWNVYPYMIVTIYKDRCLNYVAYTVALFVLSFCLPFSSDLASQLVHVMSTANGTITEKVSQ